MYDLLKALNKELDSGIENTFSNEVLKKELDDLYAKIQRYKSKEDAANIDELLKNLDKAIDNAEKSEEQINASDDFFEKIDISSNVDKTPTNQSTSNSEKEDILKDFDFDIIDNSISIKTFLRGIVLMISIVAYLGVFVFIREKIYQNSRVYGELMSRKEVLLEEQKELQRKIESLQFQNNIMNYFER